MGNVTPACESGGPTTEGERRKYRRYNLTLELRYKTVRGRRAIEMGRGTTCDLSTGGLAFFSEQALPSEAAVEIWMDWPVLLHDEHPLRLVIFGKVVRSNSALTAVRTTRYEFRTAGTQQLRQSLAWALMARSGGQV